MDTILVVNAGSSSVKFQVFETDGKSALTLLIKGQMDGIGVRPRLRAAASDGAPLIDAAYAPERVGDVLGLVLVSRRSPIKTIWVAAPVFLPAVPRATARPRSS